MLERQACHADGWPARRTACGLCYLQKWASLKYPLTTALLSAIYVRHFPQPEAGSAAETREWALGQLGYALGDNPKRRSFMVGLSGGGALRSPRKPHHRSSS